MNIMTLYKFYCKIFWKAVILLFASLYATFIVAVLSIRIPLLFWSLVTMIAVCITIVWSGLTVDMIVFDRIWTDKELMKEYLKAQEG